MRPTKVFTASGEYLDFDRPVVGHVHLNDVATGLANICRWGGQLPSSKWYSVAEHSCLVATLTDLMLEDLTPHFRGIGKLLGLLHDGSEAYLGDVITPIKHQPWMAPYRAREAAVQLVIEKKLVRLAGFHPNEIWSHIRDVVKKADDAAGAIEASFLQDRMMSCQDTPTMAVKRLAMWDNETARAKFLSCYWDTIALMDKQMGVWKS